LRAAFFCPSADVSGTKPVTTDDFLMGLACVAAAAEAEGVEVLVRTNCTIDELLREFTGAWRRFDLVAMQAFVTNWFSCVALARNIKEAHPACHIVVGGVHPTNFPEECLDTGVIDWVVRGEADITIRSMIRQMMAKLALNEISGLAFKLGGQTIVNTPGQIPHDLDELPFPAWHLIYSRQKKISVGHVLTSRGCPYHCAQCPMVRLDGNAVREASIERVRSEIDILVNKYRLRHIDFMDETFTINPERVEKLCEMLRTRSMRVTWRCFTRPQLVSRELLKNMADAGCRAIFYGIGTGSQRLMEILKSDIDLDSVKDAVSWTEDAGISATAAFSIGIPHESFQESLQTIVFARQLKASRIFFQFCYPFPGSRLHEVARLSGCFLTSDWAVASAGQLIYVPDGRRSWELRALKVIARLSANTTPR